MIAYCFNFKRLSQTTFDVDVWVWYIDGGSGHGRLFMLIDILMELAITGIWRDLLKKSLEFTDITNI